MTDNSNEFESIQHADMDTFKFGDDKSFSHELLVQEAYRKCLQSLSVEMTEGYIEIKKDIHGNILSTRHPDTRMTAIEAIKTLKNAMIADLDNTGYKKEIKILLEDIDDLYSSRIKEQQSFINSLPYELRGQHFSEWGHDKFFSKSPYYHEYMSDKLEVYRGIFEQLELCLAKTKYFKKAKQGQY